MAAMRFHIALLWIGLIALTFLLPYRLQAQFFRLTDYSITATGNIPLTDLDASSGGGIQMNFKNSFLDRFSVDMEVGASYLHGPGWSTIVAPIGFRYKYVPTKILGQKDTKFTPFATIGGSLAFYNNMQLSDSLVAGLDGTLNEPAFAEMELTSGNGLTLMLPIRTGVIYRRSPFMDLELSAGYNVILTDGLDRAALGQFDGMLSVGLGVNFKNRGQKRVDSDRDGIPNFEEMKMGMDPMNPDSDSDGLLDGEEQQYGTDPLNPDSDGDRIIDGNEVMVFMTDPLNPDTDGDGRDDYRELNEGTDPLVPDYPGQNEPEIAQEEPIMVSETVSTPPKNNMEPDEIIYFDQDRRALTDQEKQQVMQFIESNMRGTNKKVFLAGHADLSGQVKSPIYNAELAADRAKAVRDLMLSAGIEEDRIVIKSYGFDRQKNAPLELRDQHQQFRKVDMITFDTDEELMQILSSDDRPKASLSEDYQNLAAGNRLAVLYFMYSSSKLLPDSQRILEQLASFLTSNPSARIRVEGHTDAVGPTNVNQQVSEQRANTIKAQLVSLGVSSSQITTRGYGESRPLMLNETELGRSMNRRIEIIRAQ